MKGWIIGGGILLVIVMWLVGTYNSFIGLNEDVSTAWAQVENQYQRRMDLIPNIVSTVQGAANFEKSTLTAVIEARAKATQVTLSPELINDPAAFQQFQQSQGELSGALSRLLVSVEAYPSLKANENFLALQTELEGTENRISTERMRFNDVVKAYNVRAKGFPGVFFVSIFGLPKERQLFSATEGADKAPAVQFNFGS